MRIKLNGGNLVLSRRERRSGQGGVVCKLQPILQGVWTWGGVVLLTAIAALLSVWFLRQNNLNMMALRDQLVANDQTGDVALVQQSARELQNYVAHHMNTATGRVALQTLYDQAAEQAMEGSKPPEISTTVYQRATEDCRPQLTNYGYRAWASCVASKVGLNTTTALATADAVAPDPDLYYVEYASARWSADLAGITLAIAVIGLIVLVVRLLAVAVRQVYRYCRKRLSAGVYRG